MTLPNDPRVRDITVRPHRLTDYEQLTQETCDERPDDADTSPERGTDAQQPVARVACANGSGAPTSTAYSPKPSRSCMNRGSRMSLRSRRANASVEACAAVWTGARLGIFKPLADFDYDWPKELDRQLLDELMTLSFLSDAANVIIVGPNGLGKTMLAKNILHQAILRGHTARFTLASDMLHDLAAQDSSTQLTRRLRRYTTPAAAVRGRGRIFILRLALRRSAVRGHHAPLSAARHHLDDQQTLRRMEPGLPQRRLRRHARRSAGASLRNPHHRRRQLPTQGSSGTRRARRKPQRSAKKPKQ